MNSFHHAQSCARKWGGEPEDYLPIHEFIDSSKSVIGDVRHRSVYHHTLGVYLCQRIFGNTITVQKKTKAVRVPVRLIAERHILEDLGWIPSPKDYIDGRPWHHCSRLARFHARSAGCQPNASGTSPRPLSVLGGRVTPTSKEKSNDN